MHKPPTKADLRRQLATAVQRFLETGGSIEQVPHGISGRSDNTPVKPSFFDGQKQPRTYVTGVIAQIESRRTSQLRPQQKKAKQAVRPRLKVVYDDFGEPVRRVWTDE